MKNLTRPFFFIFSALMLLSDALLYCAPLLSQQVANRERKKKKVAKIKDRDGNTISTMPLETLKKIKDRLMGQKDLFTAAKYLEEMVKVCDDHVQKQALMLELGDAWYEQKDYKHAQRVYEEFGLLYPGSDNVGLAFSREIECSFHQLLSYDRDQTQTEKTLELCERFFERKDVFAEHMPLVLDIQEKTQRRYFDHELGIARDYLRRNNIKAAQHRISTIHDAVGKRFSEQITVFEPEVYDFKIQLAQAMADSANELKLKIELAQKYPDNKIAIPFVTELPDLKLQLAALDKSKTAPAITSSTSAAVHMADKF